MPFFRHFFHLFNIVLRLRAGIPIPAEPTRDMGTLRRIQRSTNLQELVCQSPSQAFAAYPAPTISHSSNVSSIASDSDAEFPDTATLTTTDSDSDSHSDISAANDSEDDTPIYMKPRTRCPGTYRLEVARQQKAQRKSFGFS